jgi:hypothetical protein
MRGTKESSGVFEIFIFRNGIFKILNCLKSSVKVTLVLCKTLNAFIKLCEMPKNCLKQGVCHTLALPYALKSILREKKNYGNSNISPLKNIIFKKSFKRNQNPSRYYNSITNLKFQYKPKYHLSKILI